MIIYFSGTGNSRFAAQAVNGVVGGDCVDSFAYIRNAQGGEFDSDTPYVFVCPTYSWRIPRVFASFIKNSTFSGSKKAYFIMTCGSEIGNSENYIKKLCKACGLDFMGVAQIVMPENYIALFSVPDKQKADKIIRDSLTDIYAAAKRIKQGEQLDKHKTSVVDILKSSVVNRAFYRFIVSAKDFTASDQCISCGKCSSVCPLGNIKLVDSKPEWGNSCTHCMACISLCPVRAIEYGTVSKNRNRFYNSYDPAEFK